MEALKIIIKKQVNMREIVVLLKGKHRNPLKKYNFSKQESRKLTEQEFKLIKESYEQSI